MARSPGDRPALVRAGLAGVVIIALGYLPLLAHELGHGFAETRGAIAWLTSGDATSGAGLAVRLLFVPLRVVSWPLSGPIAASIAVAVVAVAAWVGLVALALLRARGSERRALAWLAGSTGLAIAALALGVRSLSVVTPLPADHYHAFLWPAIAAAAGVAAAVLWRRGPRGRRGGGLVGRGVVVVTIAAFVGWNLATQPPAIAADGGWPAAESAARRVVAAVAGSPTAVVGVPSYKGTGALDYPMTVLGNPPVPGATAARVAVLCDELFEEVVGAACRGPAEEARLAEVGIPAGPLLDRFEAAPGALDLGLRGRRPLRPADRPATGGRGAATGGRGAGRPADGGAAGGTGGGRAERRPADGRRGRAGRPTAGLRRRGRGRAA